MNMLIREIYSCKQQWYTQHSWIIIGTESTSYLIHEVDTTLITNMLKVAC